MPTVSFTIEMDENDQTLTCEYKGKKTPFTLDESTNSDSDFDSDDISSDDDETIESVTIHWDAKRLYLCQATPMSRLSKISSIQIGQSSRTDLHWIILLFSTRQHPSFKSKAEGITLGSDIHTVGSFRDDTVVKVSFITKDELTGGND